MSSLGKVPPPTPAASLGWGGLKGGTAEARTVPRAPPSNPVPRTYPETKVNQSTIHTYTLLFDFWWKQVDAVGRTCACGEGRPKDPHRKESEPRRGTKLAPPRSRPPSRERPTPVVPRCRERRHQQTMLWLSLSAGLILEGHAPLYAELRRRQG